MDTLRGISCKVLITVPLRALLDQFAMDFPGFCKVGKGHNEKIDFDANGFIAVSKSVHLLQKLRFDAVFVDEAHHPLPKRLPKRKELFQFSATLEEEKGIDFQYTMGKAIEDGVLCDYDITVPAVTAHHAYVCLADLLIKQAGRFRRVLAYCNTVAEAKRFQMVLEELGLAAWHINARTGWKERKRVMDEFTGVLKKPVHVLVNVEVLGEGINVPNADTCMFVEPRNSYRSIIQAIGRVLRPYFTKTMAHIVLPAVAIRPSATLVPADSPRHSPQRDEQQVHDDPVVLHTQSEAGKVQDTKQVKQLKSNINMGSTPSRAIGKHANPGAAHGNGMDVNVVLTDKDLQLHEISTKQDLQHPSIGGSQQRERWSETVTSQVMPGKTVAPAQLPQEPAIVSNVHHNSFSTVKPKPAVVLEAQSTDKPTAKLAIHTNPSGQQEREDFPQSDGHMPPNQRHSNRHHLQIAGLDDQSELPAADCNEGPEQHNLGKPEPISRRAQLGRQYQQRRGRPALNSLHLDPQYQTQLERFLAKLVQADHRLIGTNAGHRIQVVDCTWFDQGTLQLDTVLEATYSQLTVILSQKDQWQSHLERVEEFVEKCKRLPMTRATDASERFLGIWLRDQGASLRLERLPSYRVQCILGTSSHLLRERVDRWLLGNPQRKWFAKRCKDLRQFIEAHNCLPKLYTKRNRKNRNIPSEIREEHRIAAWLYSFRSGTRSLAPNEKNMLLDMGPRVRDFLQDWEPRISRNPWQKQFDRLTVFVKEHRRLPRSLRHSEYKLYIWFQIQRARLSRGFLPEDLVKKLQTAHPLIAQFAAKEECFHESHTLSHLLFHFFVALSLVKSWMSFQLLFSPSVSLHAVTMLSPVELQADIWPGTSCTVGAAPFSRQVLPRRWPEPHLAPRGWWVDQRGFEAEFIAGAHRGTGWIKFFSIKSLLAKM